jgi:transposase
MADFSYFIGIDVAKEKIDIFFTKNRQYHIVPNDALSIENEFEKVNPDRTLVVLENTGRYEKVCMDVLERLNFKIHRANNNRAKHHRQSEGEDDTDKIACRRLAYYGREKQRKLRVHEPESILCSEMKQITFRIDYLKKLRAAEKNRRQSPGCDQIVGSCEELIVSLTKQIEILEEKLEDLIQKDDELSKKFALIKQYTGIGDTTAKCLIAHLPELGKVKQKAIFSLCGLAPKAKDSGKSKGYRTTKGRGRPFVKKAFFMATLSAIRFNKEIAAFYEAKKQKKNCKKVVIVACMRKMAAQLNAIVKRGEMRF